MKVKLTRLEAGSYRTHDERFTITNEYDASGAPWARVSRQNSKWLVEDHKTGRTDRLYTLADSRQAIVERLNAERIDG